MKILFVFLASVAIVGCDQRATAPAEQPAAEKTADVAAATPAQADMSAMITSMSGAPMSKETAAQRMHQRHEGMEQIGKTTKAAGRAIKASSPDLATVRESAATINRLAQQSSGWFPAGTGPDVGKTDSKAEIWRRPADFAAKTKAFQQAAMAFDAAAKTGKSSAIEASFADLGKTCKSCHDSYRSDSHKK